MADSVALADKLESIATAVDTLAKGYEALDQKIEEKSKPQRFGAPGIRIGESTLTSRPFSYARLAKGLASEASRNGIPDDCKLEMTFSDRLAKAYSNASDGVSLRSCVPIGSQYLNPDQFEGAGEKLAKEWQDMSKISDMGIDPDEYRWFASRALAKDLSIGTATTGGTLLAPPTQGELIDLYRARSLFGQAGVGATEVALPQSGSIQYPRVTGGTTIVAFSEGEASTESTPTTGLITLTAKGYTGLVELTEQFFKFASMGVADAFVRNALTLDTALKIDADIINGTGGNYIQGIVRTSGISARTAGTTGNDGNTLNQKDIEFLIAQMRDANVPIDSGAFIATTSLLWTSLKYREDTAGNFATNAGYMTYGGGRVVDQLGGVPVFGTSQIPTNRAKGSATNLTLALVGIGSELMIGRAGGVEMKMTDSHGSNFASGIFTLRSTTWVDAKMRHPSAFGVIDSLLNS
jgi:HK97 family phage major capsid protein